MDWNEFYKVFRHPVSSFRKARDYDSLNNEKSNLRKRYSKLEEELPRAKKLVEKARNVALDVHTNRNVIEKRAKENQFANSDLKKWMKTYAKPLVERTKAAEKFAGVLKGAAFGIAVDTVNKLDARAKKIPFIYYDTINKNMSYTPATLDFLGVSKKEINSFTFSRLLLKIDRNYLGKGRKVDLISTIKNGNKLKHKKVFTKEGKEINLTTYPLKYKSPVSNEKRVVGMGILLNDPKLFKNPSYSFENKAFSEQLDKIYQGMINKMNHRFEEVVPEISRNAKKLNLDFIY